MINKPFEEVFNIMESSFPESEYRTREGQEALLSEPEYRIITHQAENGRIQAFMAVWEFTRFRFIEHLAVDSSVRGNGIGERLVKEYTAQSSKPVILEVEPPETLMQQRRIGFYERLGFHLNPFDYVQPPLRTGQPDLKLQIMSYPSPLDEGEFAPYKASLYTKVYKLVEKR